VSELESSIRQKWQSGIDQDVSLTRASVMVAAPGCQNFFPEDKFWTGKGWSGGFWEFRI
jgi:hypothetical protein